MTLPNQTEKDSSGHPEGVKRRKVVQLDGAKLARERKRTTRQIASLPRGITIGERRDGRQKPFFVRYGNPRKTESFLTEEDRNDKAQKLVEKVTQHGTSLLDFDPAEWAAFQAWRASKRPTVTVKDAVSRYMALRLAEDVLAESDTHLHLSLHLEQRLAGRFGDRPLDSITTEELRTWLPSIVSKKTGKQIGKVTLKHHRKDVNTFFKRAVDEGWCMKNPCAMVKPPKLDDEEKIPLRPRQIFELLKANRDEPVIGRIVLELFGGMRASSAGRAHKEHINFVERGISMPGAKHKSGKRKFRQGHPGILWAWLEHAPQTCWTEITSKNYGRLKGLAFVRARVTNPGNVLRDSFASYLLASTKDMGKVGYLMQHTRSSTTEGYEGIATEADAKLVLAMTPEAVTGTWENFTSTQNPTRT